MMKVLHVIYSLEVGGAQRLITDLLPELSNYGVSPAVLVNRRQNNEFEKKLEDNGIPIISVNTNNNYSIFILYMLLKQTRQFDVVHVHLFPALYILAFVRLFRNVRLVYTEHNTTNRRRNKTFLKRIERFVYHRYDSVVSVSDDTRNELCKWLGVSILEERFKVVKNGIDLNSFRIKKNKSPYPVTLLMISRFAEAKDQPTVIKALTHLNENIHVVFIGDGQRKIECEQLANSLGVTERVHFMGCQSDIPSFISKADIGILSTHWEGLPLTIIEMMAGGIPVVASDVDGVRQIVKGAGLLFPEGDEIALAEAITQLSTNKIYYNEIRERCLSRSSEYDIKTTAQEYNNIYCQLFKTT